MQSRFYWIFSRVPMGSSHGQILTPLPAGIWGCMNEMLKAVRITSAMRSRSVVCPYCGHKLFTVYEGTTGYIQTKCNKCKKISPINLVSMRRVRRNKGA